jgi:hypothetical protein
MLKKIILSEYVTSNVCVCVGFCLHTQGKGVMLYWFAGFVFVI